MPARTVAPSAAGRSAAQPGRSSAVSGSRTPRRDGAASASEARQRSDAMSGAQPTPSSQNTEAGTRRRSQRLVRFVFALAAVVLLGGLLSLAFHLQPIFDQRQRISESEAVLERLREEREALSKRVTAADDPVEVERIARRQLSLVREGDTLYRLSVDVSQAVELPPAWPLPGVAHLLRVR